MSDDLKKFFKGFGIDITGTETMDQLEDLWYRGSVSFHDINCLKDPQSKLIYGIIVPKPNGLDTLITDENAADLASGLTSLGYDVTDVCLDYELLPNNVEYDYCISEGKYERKTGAWINKHNHFTHKKRTKTLKAISLKQRLALANTLEPLAELNHLTKIRNTNKNLS